MSDVDFAHRLADRLQTAGLTVSAAQLAQLERYYELLSRWNPRMNLTALELGNAPPETLDRLFVEPLVAGLFLPDSSLRCLDLGSGGGSPGIPMKVVKPRLVMSLIESRERKSAFLREAVRQLRLAQVDVITARVQELPEHLLGQVDVVTVRALRIDDEIADVVHSLLRRGGQLITFSKLPLSYGFVIAGERTAGGGSVYAMRVP